MQVENVCGNPALERVAGSAVEKELPFDLGVVDLLVQPPLEVHLELVR